jgi:hypothetical protein
MRRAPDNAGRFVSRLPLDVRILVVSEGPQRLRHVDTVLVHLARAGHQVTVAVEPDQASKRFKGPLAKEESIRLDTWSQSRSPSQRHSLALLRLTRDYLRYLDPPLATAFANRARSLELLRSELGEALAGKSDAPFPLPLELSDDSHHEAARLIDEIESLVLADPGTRQWLAEQRPDVVLVTPLITHGSPQVEVIKAARELGIPSGLLVFSWDNLSNKGLIRVPPDRVFVWNDLQKREAVELHGVEPSSVVVAGASRFDPFFEMRPSMTREDLCTSYGLDPSKPIILYLGSSEIVSPQELLLASRWLAAVRGSPEPAVRAANVIFRPHPRRRNYWKDWQERDADGVAMSTWPRVQGDQTLYDELSYAVAAVGLNTSAEIEAAILGKPVLTFDGGALAPGQAGSLHFQYLLREQGGPVEHAADLDAHCRHLARAATGNYDATDIRAFAERFVRPRGLDKPVTPILARAILDLGGLREGNRHQPLGTMLRRVRREAIRRARS